MEDEEDDESGDEPSDRRGPGPTDRSVPSLLDTDDQSWPILPNVGQMGLPDLKDVIRSFVTMTYSKFYMTSLAHFAHT